jgi:hypothetical protein
METTELLIVECMSHWWSAFCVLDVIEQNIEGRHANITCVWWLVGKIAKHGQQRGHSAWTMVYAFFLPEQHTTTVNSSPRRVEKWISDSVAQLITHTGKRRWARELARGGRCARWVLPRSKYAKGPCVRQLDSGKGGGRGDARNYSRHFVSSTWDVTPDTCHSPTGSGLSKICNRDFYLFISKYFYFFKKKTSIH